jgi:xanthine dehydrogenase accessory factor
MVIHDALRRAIEAEQPIAVATVIAGAAPIGAKLLIDAAGTASGTLDAGAVTAQIITDALALLQRGVNEVRRYADGLEVFIETYPPPATLLVVGAVHIAIPLVTIARTLQFRTVVIDARGAFATPERFAHADELVHAWPDEALAGRLTSNSHVVVLTHDPKLDDPALLVALPSAARYVGALGSPRTHARRLERLRAAGVGEAQLARLHAPIGLRIGGQSPAEIAVSIIAEIVAVRNGRSGAVPS